MAGAGVACARLDTAVDTAAFAPGGVVAVRVSCTATFADLAALGVPGERRFDARSAQVVDRFRAEAGS